MANGLVEGAVSLVTGAGAGIGKATAELLAAEGASVVYVTDRNEASAEEVAAGIRESGGCAVSRRLEVSEPGEMEALVAEIVAAHGGLDCAVNNAGITGNAARLVDLSDEEWRSVLDVNLTGVFFGLRSQIPAMVSSGGGTIVNVSSAIVRAALPRYGAYAASKFGVDALTKTAASEHCGDNVRVNSVHPGSIWTTLYEENKARTGFSNAIGQPLGRFGQPSEVAQAIVWLSSPRSSFVHGTAILVDGGSHEFTYQPMVGSAADSAHTGAGDEQ